MQIHKKSDTVDVKGMGTMQRKSHINVTMAKLEKSTVLLSMLLVLL